MDFSFADSRDPQTYAIIGAGIEVHKTLGRGYLEAVYQDTHEIEFQRAGIPSKGRYQLPFLIKVKPLMPNIVQISPVLA
jgi:GxxExxY protein